MPPGATTRTGLVDQLDLPGQVRPGRRTRPGPHAAGWPADRAAQVVDHFGQDDRRPDRVRPSKAASAGPHDGAPGVDGLHGRPASGQGRPRDRCRPARPSPPAARWIRRPPIRRASATHAAASGVGRSSSTRPDAQRVAGDSSRSTRADRNCTASSAASRSSVRAVGRHGPDLVHHPFGVLGEVLGHELDHVTEHPLAGLGAPAPLPQVGREPGPAGDAAAGRSSARPADGPRRRRPTAAMPCGARPVERLEQVPLVGRQPGPGIVRRAHVVVRSAPTRSSASAGHRAPPRARRPCPRPAAPVAPSASAAAGPGRRRPRGTWCSGR